MNEKKEVAGLKAQLANHTVIKQTSVYEESQSSYAKLKKEIEALVGETLDGKEIDPVTLEIVKES